MATRSLQDLLTTNFGQLPSGYTGSRGNVGFTGSAGQDGVIGVDGYTGSQGTQGNVGYTGSAGQDGVIGVDGYTGSQGAAGYTGSTGLGFNIAKQYANVALLEADTTPANIEVGEFALINTGNVENAENSRLYIWDGNTYTYVNDLSGAAGITGPIGYTGSAGADGTIGTDGNVGYTGSAGGVLPWTSITANYTAANNDRLLLDTSGGSFYLTLPATPSTGTYIQVTDAADFSVANVVVDPNGSTIESSSNFIALDIANATFEFIYDGTTWQLTSTAGPQGVRGYTGSAGADGNVGYTGSGGTGYTGSAGADGNVGYTGSGGTGYTGSAGADGGVLPWTVKTANYTAVDQDRLLLDTSGGSFYLTLPATPTTGTYVQVTDAADFSVANVVVDPNGSTIESSSNFIALDIANATFEFIYDGSTWQLTSTAGPQGARGYTGSAGVNGYTGADGYTGSQGNVGYVGSSGIDGNVGYTGSAGGVLPWASITANYTAVSNDRLLLDTAGGSFYLTLPATPAAGTYVQVTDAADLSVNSVIVEPNGSTIEGSSNQLALDIPNTTYEFIYDGTTWQVTSTVGPKGDTGYTGSEGAGYAGSQGDLGYTGSIGYTGSASSFNQESITGNLVPAANVAYDLGSADYRWRDLYLSGNTINLGGATISASGNSVILPAGTQIGSANVATESYVSTAVSSAGGGATVSSSAPSSPSEGDLWFHTSKYVMYQYANLGLSNSWIALTGRMYNFGITASMVSTINNSIPVIADLLVVAGGGGGGSGGGGAGGLIAQSSVYLTSGALYSIVVGGGGPGQANQNAYGTNGSDSSMIGDSLSITTTGGGRGAGPYSGQSAGNGGSGGGGTEQVPTGGTGIAGQGYNGATWAYTGGNTDAAGGGAGGAGSVIGPNQRFGGTGGLGYQWTDGNYYASGGAGGTTSADFVGYAPPGGGGGSNSLGDSGSSAQISHAGTANTGGGGSGQYWGSYYGAAGGSGVVMVRINSSLMPGLTGSPTVTDMGDGTTMYAFTSSGSLQL